MYRLNQHRYMLPVDADLNRKLGTGNIFFFHVDSMSLNTIKNWSTKPEIFLSFKVLFSEFQFATSSYSVKNGEISENF